MNQAALGWVVAFVLVAMLAVPVIVGVRRSRQIRRERRRRWAAADGTGAAGFYAGGGFDGGGGDCGGGGCGGGGGTDARKMACPNWWLATSFEPVSQADCGRPHICIRAWWSCITFTVLIGVECRVLRGPGAVRSTSEVVVPLRRN
jgi:hypothetical protein